MTEDFKNARDDVHVHIALVACPSQKSLIDNLR